MKKYELTSEFITNIYGIKLFRIKALISFGDIEAGELGGYIEKEENLSQTGDAWVCGDAKVSGNAKVRGNAEVSGNAEVRGDAWVYGDADYAVIQGFGSCFRTTTFFKTKNKQIKVVCGCFFGTIEEFKEKVKETHGDSKFAREYLAVAEAMEIHFDTEERSNV